MSEQIPLCEVPVFEGESYRLPSAEYWLVAAYRTTPGLGGWRIFQDRWTNRQAAEDEARRKLAKGCWTAMRILHVRLGPIRGQDAADLAVEEEKEGNA